MANENQRKRTARTGGTVGAAIRKGVVLFPFPIIPDSTIDYKHGLAAVYRYILSAEWGVTNACNG